jgi:hypothetical protein
MAEFYFDPAQVSLEKTVELQRGLIMALREKEVLINHLETLRVTVVKVADALHAKEKTIEMLVEQLEIPDAEVIL